MIAETSQAVHSLLETFWAMGQDIVLQEYVRESKGRDIRVIVVGGRVVASMRRVAKAGEFRSNLHRGGTAVGVVPSADECDVAIRATRVLGLGVAGVDLIRSDRGPLVLEVNASPGLEGIESASKKDIAGEIVAFVAQGCRPVKPARKRRSK
jgi:ribosomal protein S6--L-glutamate ligase